jgi:thiol-disulfide isomerase/thioredoxin
MRGQGRHTTMRVIVIALVLAVAGPAAAQVLNVGDKLAELDVAKDEGNRSFKLKSLKGKWLVVTVGASWCKPCKKELPTGDKMAANMKDKAVFVAINADNDVKDGKKFNKTLNLKSMKLVYLPADKSAVVARYGSDTMPTTFVIDPNGVVKFRKDGFQERDPDGEYKKFRGELAKLIR